MSTGMAEALHWQLPGPCRQSVGPVSPSRVAALKPRSYVSQSSAHLRECVTDRGSSAHIWRVVAGPRCTLMVECRGTTTPVARVPARAGRRSSRHPWGRGGGALWAPLDPPVLNRAPTPLLSSPHVRLRLELGSAGACWTRPACTDRGCVYEDGPEKLSEPHPL